MPGFASRKRYESGTSDTRTPGGIISLTVRLTTCNLHSSFNLFALLLPFSHHPRRPWCGGLAHVTRSLIDRAGRTSSLLCRPSSFQHTDRSYPERARFQKNSTSLNLGFSQKSNWNDLDCLLVLRNISTSSHGDALVPSIMNNLDRIIMFGLMA